MKIELLNNNTIKVVLTVLDLLDYDIDYHHFDEESIETKSMLFELLDIIKDEKNIVFDNEKLFVEFFPDKYSGCVVYISEISSTNNYRKEDNPTEIVFQTNDIGALLCFSDRLIKTHKNIDIHSELYYLNGEYRMIILSKLEEKITPLMSEFGLFLDSGEKIAASTREYYNKICNDKAIQRLSKLNA